jgi:streptogramin lyase
VAADPDAIIKVGGDIWVASCKGNEITVINDSTKQIVAEYGSNSNYQLDCPDALAFDDGYVWIANRANSSLVQLNASTGAWVQTQTGSDILYPNVITVSGSDIWVSNNSFLSEFNATSGANIYVTKNSLTHALLNVGCITAAGSNIWVSDSGGSSAYEYNSSSGAYLRSTLAGGGGMSGTICVSYDDGYIWVTSFNNNLVLEYNASTGAYIREISIVNPNQVIFTGSKLFVVSVYPLDSVLEYNAAGRLLNTVVNKVNTGFYRANGMAMLYDGGNLWVANPASNNVTLYKV